MLIIPRTGRKRPSRESSPTKMASFMSASRSWPERIKTESAIGRSRCGPSLLSSAGAREIVTRFKGNLNPADFRAFLTRSLASLTVLLAKPTRLKVGNPSAMAPSTSINAPSAPTGTIAETLAVLLMGGLGVIGILLSFIVRG